MTMPSRIADRRGLTLIELMIVVVMMGIIGATTLSLFRSQNEAFRHNTDRFDLLQNLRSAMELSERTIRTMGTGVTGQQPMIVYASDNVLAFNADYVERDTTDMRWSAYFNPDVPAEETVAWDASAATVIPNSSPSYTYPSETYRMGGGTGAVSPAETYILYFESDSDTPRSDDYILWQRVNNGAPELLARNILPPTGGGPFFDYLLHRISGGADQLIVASSTSGVLPLIRRPLHTATSAADSASYIRPDSVRAVRISFRVTNGLTGSEERIREISTTVETPNNGVSMPTVCGRPPLPPGSLSAVDAGDGSGKVTISWTSSQDQDAGEVDVRQYIVWRRLASASDFAAPLMVVRAEPGEANYSLEVLDHVPGQSYVYRIASQDCTPNLSAFVQASATVAVVP